MNRYEREKLKQREEHKEKRLEETMDDIRLKAKEECYYLKKRPAGDEVYYWCDLDDHPCGVEYNDEECEEYNDQIKELEKEAKNGRTNYRS